MSCGWHIVIQFTYYLDDGPARKDWQRDAHAQLKKRQHQQKTPHSIHQILNKKYCTWQTDSQDLSYEYATGRHMHHHSLNVSLRSSLVTDVHETSKTYLHMSNNFRCYKGHSPVWCWAPNWNIRFLQQPAEHRSRSWPVWL